MSKRAIRMLISATIGGGGSLAAMYLFSEKKPTWSALVARAEEKKHFGNSPSLLGKPTTKWLYDWDTQWYHDCNNNNVGEDKENNSPADGYSNKIKSDENKPAKPVATRHIILIRHGQYNLKGEVDKERFLTPLGQQQADATGRRLKELGLMYTRLIHSTMTRANETAIIIHKHLKDVPVESTDLLREGAPYPPEPPISSWNPTHKDFYEDGARIEAAFRKYFHRADVSQVDDTYELLVCHANVIRYFLCRVLQLPPEAWLRFTLHNCSLTWIKIRPSGRVGAYIIGDCGHMPPSLMTTS